MSDDTRHVISFHSQKGGVGKSVLAWHLVSHLAKPGLHEDRKDEKPLRVTLVDGDLTGTSIADAEDLRAARTGTKTPSFSDAATTVRIIREEYRGAFPDTGSPPVVFLNRLLLSDPTEFAHLICSDVDDAERYAVRRRAYQASFAGLPHYAWRTAISERLRVIPSSSYPRDVREIAPHLFREDMTSHFSDRLADLVLTLIGTRHTDGGKRHNAHPSIGSVEADAVIIDSPPGLHGLSRAVLQCHDELARRISAGVTAVDVRRTAVFVGTDDLQDIAALSRSLNGILRAAGSEDAQVPDGLRRLTRLLLLNRYRDRDPWPNGAKRLLEAAGAPGRKWDMTEVREVGGYYHEKLQEYVAAPHPSLERPPGDPESVFADMLCVPFDDGLAKTFKSDRASGIPSWQNADVLLQLIRGVLD
ncbi:MAG: P-loop NTPase [Armatimonadota bacterium]|nr:P-loop NTPase [Armatimonadota bacterium]